MWSRAFQAWGSLLQKYWIWFLLPFLLSLGPLFVGTKNLFKNIDTDFAALLPEDDPNVLALEQVQSRFKSFKSLIILFETFEPEATRQEIPRIAAYLELDSDVEKVLWRKSGFDFLKSKKLFFLTLEELKNLKERIDRRIQQEKLGKLFVNLEEGEPEDPADIEEEYRGRFSKSESSEFFTNDAGTIFTIDVRPRGSEAMNVRAAKVFLQKIRERLSALDLDKRLPQTKIHWGGGLRNSVAEYDTLVQDVQRASIISVVLIFGLVLLYYRRLESLVIIGIPLLFGLFASFSLAWFFVGKLNMITAFLFSILTGLGIDFEIHMLCRFYEELNKGKTFSESLSTILVQTGRANFTAAATTVAVFLFLLLNEFRGFSEFGWIAGIGVAVVWISSMSLLPLLLVLFHRLRLLPTQAFSFGFPILDKSLEFFRRRPRGVILGGLLLTLFAIVSLPFLKFDYDFTKLRAKIPEVELAKEKFRELTKRKNVPVLFLADNLDSALGLEKVIAKKREKNQAIDTIKTVMELVPESQEEKVPLLREIHELLMDDIVNRLVKEDKKEVLEDLKKATLENPFTLEDVTPELLETFFGQEKTGGSQFVYVWPPKNWDTQDGRLAIQFSEAIEKIDLDGKVYYAAGSPVIFGRSLKAMIRDSKKAMFISIVTILLFLWFDFRKPKQIVVAIFPLGVAFFWLFGFLWASGLNLNFYNMVTLPILVGMGIDHSVHLYHRVRHEGVEAWPVILKETGGAIFMAVITTVAGFSGLALASHGGLSSLGITAMVGLTFTLVTATVLFPALFAIPQFGFLGILWRKKIVS